MVANSKAEEARRLFASGEQQRNIAKILGITPQQVSAALKSVKMANGTYNPRHRPYGHATPGTTYLVDYSPPAPPPDPEWITNLKINQSTGLTEAFTCWRLQYLDVDDTGRVALFGAQGKPVTQVLSPKAVHNQSNAYFWNHPREDVPSEGCICGYHAEVDAQRLLAMSPSQLGFSTNPSGTAFKRRYILVACRPIGKVFCHDQGIRASQIRITGFAPIHTKVLPGLIQAVLRLDEPVPVYENIDSLLGAVDPGNSYIEFRKKKGEEGNAYR